MSNVRMLETWLVAINLAMSTLPGQQSALSLEIKPVQERYCLGDDDVAFLQLQAHFILRNSGSQSLLIPRSRGRVVTVLIARDSREMRLGRYELSYAPTFVDWGEDHLVLRARSP